MVRVFARIDVLSKEAEEAERALELRRLGRRLCSVHTELAGYNRTLAQVDCRPSPIMSMSAFSKSAGVCVVIHARSSIWHLTEASCLVPVSLCRGSVRGVWAMRWLLFGHIALLYVGNVIVMQLT